MTEAGRSGSSKRTAPSRPGNGSKDFHPHAFLFQDRLIFIAPGYSGVHSIQLGACILFTLQEQSLHVECADGASYRCRLALVHSDHVTAIRAQGALVAVQLYPATRGGIGLSRHLGDRKILTDAVPPPRPGPFLSAIDDQDPQSHAALLDASEALIADVLAPWDESVEIDARVLQVRDRLLSAPPQRLRLQDLASSVNLSGDRLTHLFTDQAGISLRSFSLWCKANRAIEIFARRPDMDWASLAHEAGFSDLSHGIRTLRQYFGVNPGWVRSEKAPRFVHVNNGRY